MNISTLCSGAFSKIAKSDYKLCNVCLSVRTSIPLSIHMEQHGSHSTDFHKIWYLRISQKAVHKEQVLLKSYKNMGSLSRYLLHGAESF
jgi:hypothetical protein